jgi:hypothetical protein
MANQFSQLARRKAQSQQQNQIFTRLMVPTEHAAMQPVISDLYDKLAALQSTIQKLPAPAK